MDRSRPMTLQDVETHIRTFDVSLELLLAEPKPDQFQVALTVRLLDLAKQTATMLRDLEAWKAEQARKDRP